MCGFVYNRYILYRWYNSAQIYLQRVYKMCGFLYNGYINVRISLQQVCADFCTTGTYIYVQIPIPQVYSIPLVYFCADFCTTGIEMCGCPYNGYINVRISMQQVHTCMCRFIYHRYIQQYWHISVEISIQRVH